MFEINFPELYKEERFVAAVYAFSIMGKPVCVTKYIIFEKVSDDEILDVVYYYCLYSHKYMAERQFFMYKGTDKEYYNFHYDVDFKKIDDYKL
jgi:hypothetical protein